jgi:cytochrome oxidase Cu insertion factor (SCO1/SenC/PrrC family)
MTGAPGPGNIKREVRSALGLEGTVMKARVSCWLSAAVVLGAVLVGCTLSGKSEGPTQNKPAPDIVATDQDGKEFKLSDYRGKVVLLDFWFST